MKRSDVGGETLGSVVVWWSGSCRISVALGMGVGAAKPAVYPMVENVVF